MNPDCRACEGIEPLTPESVANRPGLPALRYRAGRHGSFLESMIARLSAQFEAPAAPGEDSGRIDAPSRPTGAYRLQTREPGDPSIALLDAWATVGDVLSFYQERIANEGYLRTAREERSLHELAGLVGYKLRPTLSSSVHLAFDVQAPPALDPAVPPPKPHNVLIPRGTQVKSIPGSGELPQTFETSEAINARPEWNELKPLVAKPMIVRITDDEGSRSPGHDITTLRFEGMSHSLQTGELLLLIQVDKSGSPAATLVRQIGQIRLDQERKQTIAVLVPSPFAYTTYERAILDGASRFLDSLPTAPLKSSILAPLLEGWKSLVTDRSRLMDRPTLASVDDAISAALLKTKTDFSFIEKVALYTQVIAELKKIDPRPPAAMATPSVRDQLILAPHTAFTTTIQIAYSPSRKTSEFLTDIGPTLATLAQKLLSDPPAPAGEIKPLVGDPDAPTPEPGSLLRRLADSGLVIPNANELLRSFCKTVYSSAAESDDTRVGKFKDAIKSLAGTDGPAAAEAIFNSYTDDSFLEILLDNQVEELANDPWTNSAPAPNVVIRALRRIDTWSEASYWHRSAAVHLDAAIANDIAIQWKKCRRETLRPIWNVTKQISDAILKLEGLSPEEVASVKQMLFSEADLDDPMLDDKNPTLGDFAEQLFRLADQINGPRPPFHEHVNSDAEQSKNAILSFEADWRRATESMHSSIVADAKSLEELMTTEKGKSFGKDLHAELEKIQDVSKSSSGRISAMLAVIDTKVPVSGSVPGVAPEELEAIVAFANNARARLHIKARGVVPPKTIPPGAFGEIPILPVRAVEGDPSFRQTELRNIFSRDGGDLTARLMERLGGAAEKQALKSWGRPRDIKSVGKVLRFKIHCGLFGAAQPEAVELHPEIVNNEPRIKVNPMDPLKLEDEPKDQSTVFLDHEYSDVTAGGWCLIGSSPNNDTGKATSLRVEDFEVFRVQEATVQHRHAHRQSGKTTRMQLSATWREEWKPETFSSRYRSTIVMAASMELPLAERVIEEAYPDDLRKNVDGPGSPVADVYQNASELQLADYQGDLETGRIILISGEQVVPMSDSVAGQPTGLATTRIHRIVAASSTPDETESNSRVTTTLRITPELDVRFRRDSVRIYANVAEATHGESQSEVLGNGEGQGAFQRFLLSQRRLTHLPSASPSGMSPELELRVNDVAWDPAERVGDLQPSNPVGLPALAGTTPTELPNRYLTSFDDEERAFITTGDGISTGARLPTGIANVRVNYRVGGGQSGNVKEGSITQMTSPPLNVAKVRNLFPSTGGVDRETVDQARKNVPVAVEALDRLVSVADYESFVRRFAGIAKAQSQRLMTDHGEKIAVTIAGLGDALIDPESLLFRNLTKALKEFADPQQQIELLFRELVLLLVWARIKINAKYEFPDVELRIRKRLLDAFNFENAELGGDVELSNIVNVIQNTMGVEYVDIEMFDSVRQRYSAAELNRKIESLAVDLSSPIKKLPKTSVTIAAARFLRDDDDKVFEESKPRRPGSPFTILPAQIAYFTDLPGTILLEEIP